VGVSTYNSMVLPQLLMKNVETLASRSNRLLAGHDDGADEDDQEDFKRLTRDEAQVLRAELPQISVWWLMAAQVAVGLLIALGLWLAYGNKGLFWSALYGAAVVVAQAVMMAAGMARLSNVNANVTAFNFMFWELLKIGVALAMMASATRIVPGLSWLAMLATMLVCMKMNWLALLWQGRVKTTRS
jgi:ATP synthase protein I